MEENMFTRSNVLKILVFLLLYNNIYGQENDTKNEFTGITITKSFGSFSIPEDWVEITRYSRNGKYFYSHKSEPVSLNMTNISIEIGSNPYALDDHMTFRYAILRQLLMQAKGMEVGGSGTFTKHDDPLYIFTIEDKVNNITTIQYYIIGNRKHILIHVTDFHNKNITNAEEVAKFMADSFIWGK
jgi:hypothetical protein